MSGCMRLYVNAAVTPSVTVEFTELYMTVVSVVGTTVAVQCMHTAGSAMCSRHESYTDGCANDDLV